MTLMKQWLVSTPVYDCPIDWVEGCYQPVTAPACDTAIVEAETRREAIVQGVREMRTSGCFYYTEYNPDGSPFTGVTADELDDLEVCT